MIVDIVAWLASLSLAVFLLWTARRRGGAFVAKAAIASIVLGMALVIGVGVVLRRLEIRPSDDVVQIAMQLLMTLLVIAMLNIMNILFHGLVEMQIAFHQRFNVANLHRFPVRFVIAHRQRLKRVATILWCFAAALMLYGVWFDMRTSHTV
ncbi:hypothetical protein [Sphingomonas sp.]|uniref:hypothetical protein n=1 Tax=Sphingomonas sp. TaxID=28214 RepID=UPI003B3AD3DA